MPEGVRQQFQQILEQSSAELFEDNRSVMTSGELVPTPNVIDDGDLELFFAGIGAGLVTLYRGGKFNTFDRPKQGGRWSLLSRSKTGGWYNAEYLPQLAACAEAILTLEYPRERVLFELPASALQLDLAILDDDGRVVVLGEAKRERGMLDKLRVAVETRFAAAEPATDTKKRGDEARQLAWRLWTVRPAYAWLIAPGQRDALRCEYEPLRLTPVALPHAAEIGLGHRPPRPLSPPALA